MNCLSVRIVVDMVDTNEERQMIDVPDGTMIKGLMMEMNYGSMVRQSSGFEGMSDGSMEGLHGGFGLIGRLSSGLN